MNRQVIILPRNPSLFKKVRYSPAITKVNRLKVRRSATIAMFSWDDKEMMNAKTSADWFEKNPQRAMANISPVMVRSKVKNADIDYLVSCAKSFGEPGILFAENEDFVTNPCGEIGMIPKTIDGKSGWQFCNLVEINCSNVESEEDFYEVCRIASIAATIQATYDSFEYLGKTTEQIVRGSALIGVSITGYLDCPIELTEEILRKGANVVKDANFKAANELKIMPARRCTTMKPSGNASILLETESASNPAHSKRYLRHVRLNRHRGMYSFIKRNCPELIVCDKPDNTGSVIVAFPIETRDGVLLKEHDTAEKAIERVVNLFNNWVLAGDRGLENVTHNISNTIVVRADEWDSIPDMLFKYRNMIGGISLIGDFGDKAYPFAPLSSIPDSKWIQDYRDKNPAGFDELIKLANDCQKYGFDFNEMISYYDYYAQLDMRAVYAWYCYDKITSSYKGKIDWSELKSDDKENVGNMAAVSCSGGGCTIL